MTSNYKIIYYKIFCRLTQKCYIGSTNCLAKRISVHKSTFKRFQKDGKAVYCSSFEILKGNNYEVSILEEKIFTDLSDYKNRNLTEQYYIKNTDGCINFNNAVFDTKILKEYMKEYYKTNRSRILERQNSYYQNEEKRQKIKTYNLGRYHKRKLLSQ